jgi:hypothetical protein
VQVVDPCSLDEAMAVVGGPAVALRLIELARTESELTSTMAILAHLVKESWSACEELERIRECSHYKDSHLRIPQEVTISLLLSFDPRHLVL